MASKQDRLGIKCEHFYSGTADNGTELSLTVIQVSALNNLYAVLLKARHSRSGSVGRVSGLGQVSGHKLVFTNEDFKDEWRCKIELHFAPHGREVRIVTASKGCEHFRGELCPGFDGLLQRIETPEEKEARLYFEAALQAERAQSGSDPD